MPNAGQVEEKDILGTIVIPKKIHYGTYPQRKFPPSRRGGIV